jgi:transcriptional regulator with XRE-family HTH domain
MFRLMMRTSPATASAALPPQPDMFGPMLRTWRRRRGASQLALALQSGVSQRHVSFLESGRARPSREMVVQLTTALDVPLRQRNAMLLAAGFAPAYRETNFAAPELMPVRKAIDHMLRQQEPYPAVVIDRLWNLIQANEAANAFTVFLFEGPPPAPPPGKPPNILQWLLDPRALRPKIANWEEVARHLVSTTYAEILADGGEPKALAFIEEIMAYPDVPASFRKLRFEDRPQPVLTLDYVVGGKSLSVFTTISTLGTPQDVTLQEVRIECFFPADDRSDALFKSLAAKSTTSS